VLRGSCLGRYGALPVGVTVLVLVDSTSIIYDYKGATQSKLIISHLKLIRLKEAKQINPIPLRVLQQAWRPTRSHFLSPPKEATMRLVK
jgi:hypothetical protein